MIKIQGVSKFVRDNVEWYNDEMHGDGLKADIDWAKSWAEDCMEDLSDEIYEIVEDHLVTMEETMENYLEVVSFIYKSFEPLTKDSIKTDWRFNTLLNSYYQECFTHGLQMYFVETGELITHFDTNERKTYTLESFNEIRYL